MRYVYQHHPVEFSLGYRLTREMLNKWLYNPKTFGLYRRGGKLRYRNYRREIKGGMTRLEAIERCLLK